VITKFSLVEGNRKILKSKRKIKLETVSIPKPVENGEIFNYMMLRQLDNYLEKLNLLTFIPASHSQQS
jgi:hypothetical protein